MSKTIHTFYKLNQEEKQKLLEKYSESCDKQDEKQGNVVDFQNTYKQPNKKKIVVTAIFASLILIAIGMGLGIFLLKNTNKDSIIVLDTNISQTNSETLVSSFSSVVSVEVKTISYDNGDVYEGEVENDMRNGQGKMIYANGDVYEGEWINDKKNGQGKYTWYYEGGNIIGSTYEGEWKDGKRNGYGYMMYINENGDYEGEYEGEWINDQRNGHGTFVNSLNVGSEGEWRNDKLIKKTNEFWRIG